MNTDKEQITAWVQETLDELFSQGLIPFELTANEVKIEGREYVIPFNDHRLHSLRFSWTDNRSFKEAVRSALLGRVLRMRRDVQAYEISEPHTLVTLLPASPTVLVH